MTQNTTTLAAAVAGGYLLGRTKKAKLALAVASFVLGKRKGINPQQLLTEGLKKIGTTPEFARLNEQVRGDLMAAGRSMVTAAANRRLESLSDTLRTRTDALSAPGGDEEEEEPEDTEEEEPEEEPEDEEEEEEPAAEKAPAKKAAKKTAAKKAPAKKTAAKKTATKKAASRSARRR